VWVIRISGVSFRLQKIGTFVTSFGTIDTFICFEILIPVVYKLFDAVIRCWIVLKGSLDGNRTISIVFPSSFNGTRTFDTKVVIFTRSNCTKCWLKSPLCSYYFGKLSTSGGCCSSDAFPRVIMCIGLGRSITPCRDPRGIIRRPAGPSSCSSSCTALNWWGTLYSF